MSRSLVALGMTLCLGTACGGQVEAGPSIQDGGKVDASMQGEAGAIDAAQADQAADSAASCPHFGDAGGFDGTGCKAGPSGVFCEEPAHKCENICKDWEYGMSCYSADVPSTPIPKPDETLGCEIIAMPTTGAILNYCCPCAMWDAGI